MSDLDALDERLRAVERALTDSDDDLTGLRDAAELTKEVETLSARLDEVEDRLDELDAATQALRGYVGNVRAVNQSVERRADAALAKAEALEDDTLEAGEQESEEDESEVYESGRSSPCGCGCRRRRKRNVADERDATAGTDRRGRSGRSRDRSEQSRDRSEQSPFRGLLARIAEAL